MQRLIAALAAALPLLASATQGTPHSNDHGAKAGAPDRGAATSIAVPAYRSPFAEYRPFSEALEPKDWRVANDEVHETGGHIGLMKRLVAQPPRHGMHGMQPPHGAARPPPAADRK